MAQKKKGLVIALGLDEFIADFTIKRIKPDFLVLLVTEKSFAMVNSLVQNNNIKDYQVYFIKDIFSTSETIQEFLNAYNWLKEKKVNEIIIDATNSITVIEMATYVSASLIDLYDVFLGKEIDFKLIYVHAEYTQNEDGVSHEVKGTEKLIDLESPKDSLSFVNAIDAIRAFNKGMYQHSAENFELLESNTTSEKHLVYSALRNLSIAYYKWDRLDYEKAFRSLEKAKGLFKRASGFKLTNGIVEKIDNNLFVLNKLKDESKSNIIIDIYVNALRVENSQKFDGAVARLYSSLEKISQERLKRYDVISRKPDYSKLDPKVVKEFEKELGFLPVELELKKNILLLKLLGDEIGKFVFDKIKYKTFIGLIGIRNKSMYAHGTTPIDTEKYNSFKNKLFVPIFEKFLEVENIAEQEVKFHKHIELDNVLSIFEK